jgi:hypothetical protein
MGRRHLPTDQKVGGSNPSERAKSAGHRLGGRRLIWAPPKFGTTWHRIDAQNGKSPPAIRCSFPARFRASRRITLSSVADPGVRTRPRRRRLTLQDGGPTSPVMLIEAARRR